MCGWTLVWTIKTYKKFCSVFGEYIVKHMFASTKGRWFDKLNSHLLLLVILDKYHEGKNQNQNQIYDRSSH
jgi:mannose/cellobiose epimerase-like protein (N-acyl-D-glucosamine 2-epimerase family)